jgi:hypothetical protein
LEFCTPLLLWGKRVKKRVKKAKGEAEMADAFFYLVGSPLYI